MLCFRQSLLNADCDGDHGPRGGSFAGAKPLCKFTRTRPALSSQDPGTTQTPDTPHTPPTCLCRYPTPPTLGFSSRATRSERLLPHHGQIHIANHPSNSYDAEDGAVIRNIDACRTIAQTVQTSLGPFGRNKIVINHLQKMILTSDAATILRELEVVHPAAKLLVMASQQQEAEMGDATNLVIVLAGELLKKAEELIRMGLKTSDIVLGYEKAQNAAQQVLEGTGCKN